MKSCIVFGILVMFLCGIGNFVCAEQDTVDLSKDMWIVWSESDGVDTEIYVKQRKAGEWQKEIPLTDNGTEDYSPSLVLDKNGNPRVVWVGADGISSSVYSRFWDGKNWGKTYQVGDVDIYSDTFPSIAMANNGDPWVVWSGSDGKNDNIFVSKWDDRGWTSEKMVNIDNDTPNLMPAITGIPGKEEMFITWMGFNNKRYELFYTIYNEKKVGETKIFDFQKDGFFGGYPSCMRFGEGLVKVFWVEGDKYYSSVGDGQKWQGKKAVSSLNIDKFLSELLGKIDIPIWIAWNDGDLNNNFRLNLFDMKKQFAQGAKLKWSLSCVLDIFSMNEAYAETTGEPIKYIVFGDSVSGDHAGPTYGPYLQDMLNANLEPSIVYNEGYGGEVTNIGMERIDSVLRAHNANYILIMEGVNDVSNHYSTESIIFNLGQMIDKSIAFGTTPLLGSLPPRRDSLNGRTQDEINPAIVQLAAEKKVTFVDQYTKLSKDTEAYFADDKHPNQAGYEIMARTWYDAIYKLRKPENDDEDGWQCGTITGPTKNSNGNGVNFSLMFPVMFVLVMCRIYLKHLKLNKV